MGWMSFRGGRPGFPPHLLYHGSPVCFIHQKVVIGVVIGSTLLANFVHVSVLNGIGRWDFG